MIQIKNLTVKNFMSVGAATQAINFDRKDITLVLGENLDLGGDGSRNGTGKTTIINALSYALYGNALSNIRKDNLVNKTNGKNMLVSLEFAVNGAEYRIERGRKPNVLKFYVNNEATVATDEAQGDSRETQDAVERIMNMSHDMFKHVVALNTYTDPFLGLKANDQRTIIEQLLGITLLSERADAITALGDKIGAMTVAEIAAADKDDARQRFIDAYTGDPKAVYTAWANSPDNPRLYNHPKVNQFLNEQIASWQKGGSQGTPVMPSGFTVGRSKSTGAILIKKPDGSTYTIGQ